MTVKLFNQLSKSDVNIAGGKGASLGEMTQAGIPVPPGFVILAPVFDEFLAKSDLTQEIKAQLAKVNYDDVSSVERASRIINDLIDDAKFPADLQAAIFSAFSNLNSQTENPLGKGGTQGGLVAVRSSATAEDSSVASWAGELESFLNTTESTFFANVKKCWASLFTPRAIIYRNEKGMKDTHVSVAVVVQKMVQSEVAGICFTVHPVTKDANQMIIEACWGLGEFIVGGIVTPDSYVIDKRDGKMIDVNVAEQETMLVCGKNNNETVSIPSDKKAAQKLDAAQIGKLASICLDIEKHYGFPCDIEWGMENGEFFIVQSRPITTL
ncbi:MAG: PEP/pyruvate-binding domain-containing protein [Patescibacteria group bacterium]|nr:PEP/pyruvate-binding domain-containing protein [Patescibacteria group bacterium]